MITTSSTENQSKMKYKKIFLYLTGYGPFGGAKDNPTQLLIETIKKKYHNKLNTKFTQLKYSTIYEVKSWMVDKNFPKLTEMIKKSRTNIKNKDTLYIILNFGAFISESINVESEAVNFLNENITGLGPFKPTPINTKKDKNYRLPTKIDVPELLRNVQTISEKFGKKCHQSKDAGNYLCNYLMYKSIEFSYLYENVLATFVHIPNQGVISIEEEVEFLKVLIKAFEKMYLDVDEEVVNV